MADFQNTIDVLGDTVVAEMLVNRTIESFADDVITKIGDYVFYYCSALASIDTPNVTSIGHYAFQDCSALASVNIPNATSIGNGVFYNCSALTSINLPKVSRIESSTFANCSALTSINLPKVTVINNQGFHSCKALTSVDLSNSVSFGSGVFTWCDKLNVIILRASQVCPLSNTGVFGYTPFASGGTGGTVYVPQALIESYQNATNWSTLYAGGTCNFVAIEGSEYE